MSEERQGSLHRLKIVDVHGTSYLILESKRVLEPALDWLQNDLGSEWLRLSGFDDEADRRPMTILVGRSSVAGMLLSKV